MIVSQVTRDQARNVEDARTKAAELLRAAVVRPKARRMRKASRAAKERRREEKRRHAQRLRERRAERMSALTFGEYQGRSRSTAVYPQAGANFVYPTLGLSGEAGEVAEKVKKVLRDRGGRMDDETRAAVEKELGDVLWYVAQLATELGLELGAVAEKNLAKLASRKDRGVLTGSGDDR
jgi:NTP pyrophosphatase (non-canonical NTP hydrolase)